MIVTSTGIIGGKIQDQYGGRGTQFNENGVPTYSLPFKIEEAPEKTVSFAVILEDKDSYPVTGGFVWVHWLAANITRNELRARRPVTLYRAAIAGRVSRADSRAGSGPASMGG